MAKYKHNINGVEVDFTPEEEAIKDAEAKAWNDAKADRKLAHIKEIRLQKLKETDFYALGDVTMSDAMKTYRQNMRNIPANHTDEAAYDLLLARDPDTKELTHNVWSKP
tara:strand:+ start:551 stop:877 length:327 start_codon:yes stop_codon:yes gene_type:complete